MAFGAAWLGGGGASVEPAAARVTGTYRLARLGTRALPAPLVVNGVRTADGRVALDSLVVLDGTLELGPDAYAGRSQLQWVRDGVRDSVQVSVGPGVVRTLGGARLELVAPNGCSTVYAVLDGGRELRSRPEGVLYGIALDREDVFQRVG